MKISNKQNLEKDLSFLTQEMEQLNTLPNRKKTKITYTSAIPIFSSVTYPETFISSILSFSGSGIFCIKLAVQINNVCKTNEIGQE